MLEMLGQASIVAGFGKAATFLFYLGNRTTRKRTGLSFISKMEESECLASNRKGTIFGFF